MMRKVLSLLLLLYLRSEAHGSDTCKDGWKHFRGSCYQIFAKDFVLPGVNYARAMCRFHSADLVTIRSQTEQDFVYRLIKTMRSYEKLESYLGLNDAEKEMEFRWFDGSLAKYTNWKPMEPNNYNGAEGCGGITGKDGFWNDVTCTQPPGGLKGYICKKSSTAVDRRSSLIFQKKGGKGRWTGHVIGKELRTRRLVDCAWKCQLDFLCASYNYQRHLHLCQLNNGTRLENMKYWEPDTTWAYYEIDAWEKP